MILMKNGSIQPFWMLPFFIYPNLYRGMLLSSIKLSDQVFDNDFFHLH